VRVDVRRLEAKGLARAKARSRRLRTSRIRKLVFRGSLALFATLWSIVFIQLVSGNDPALSKSSAATPVRHRKPHPAPPAEADPSVTQVAPEPEPEVEFEEVEPEFEEAAPEAVEPEPEFEEAAPEPEPAPEPIITSSS
jgi:hypothetical protein